MALFAGYAWKCVRRDKIKMRGSMRTKRLRKKLYKHFDELYPKYRDELFLKKHGLTFEDWKVSVENKEEDC